MAHKENCHFPNNYLIRYEPYPNLEKILEEFEKIEDKFKKAIKDEIIEDKFKKAIKDEIIEDEIKYMDKSNVRIICFSFEYVKWWNSELNSKKIWLPISRNKTFKDLGQSIIKIIKKPEFISMLESSDFFNYEDIISLGFSTFINTISIDKEEDQKTINKEYLQGKYELNIEYDSDLGLDLTYDQLIDRFRDECIINQNCCEKNEK